MRQLGIIFNTRRVLAYFLLLILGISIMFYGIISYFADMNSFNSSLSDDEIITRAKALGLVEIKDLIEDNKND